MQAGIRAAITSSMEGLPASLLPMGIAINSDATMNERQAVSDILLSLTQHTSCFARFCMGDWWNSLSREYGHRHAILESMYGDRPDFERLYRDYRDAGWIAAKYQQVDRKADKSFYWHKQALKDCLRIHIDDYNAKTNSLPITGERAANMVSGVYDRERQVFAIQVSYGDKVISTWCTASSITEGILVPTAPDPHAEEENMSDELLEDALLTI